MGLFNGKISNAHVLCHMTGW